MWTFCKSKKQKNKKKREKKKSQIFLKAFKSKMSPSVSKHQDSGDLDMLASSHVKMTVTIICFLVGPSSVDHLQLLWDSLFT